MKPTAPSRELDSFAPALSAFGFPIYVAPLPAGSIQRAYHSAPAVAYLFLVRSMMPRNIVERSSIFLNVSILPLLLICGDDPNPRHRPAAPVIQLPQPDARVKPLKEPAPKYRFEARQKHWEGTGLIELAITRDGIVTGVTVLQSTGHALLDRDAADALRGWRFKPSRHVDRVRIPVTFSLHCSP